MKPRILDAGKIHESAVAKAREFADVDVKVGLEEDALAAIIGDYDAIMVRSKPKVTKKVIDAGTKLKIIARAGVGLDNVDKEAAKARNITVVNSPEASTISVAEHAFALLLALCRNITKGDKMMREGKWDRKMMGTELYGKTLGLVGFGRIGKEVASRAKAFGMKVIAADPIVKHEEAKALHVELVSLDTLFKTADVISLHVPAIPETKDIINEKTLAMMKPTALIVNTARGHAIDEDALYKALSEKKIAGAALDVYKKEPPEGSPLPTLENIVLVPHFGANTHEGQTRAGMVIVEKLRDYFAKHK
ncbi:MAG: hydroxyacid dehydrogenase [Candidatus Altiarchaeota archaeon]